MIIGIDASRAFSSQRTGIEEYSYQIIKNLAKKLNDHQIILYLRKKQKIDFSLPENWRIKIIKWPYLWTQVGLSLEMFFHPVEALFVPSHTVPWIHPARNASLFYLALAIQKLLKIFGIKTDYNSHSDAGGPKNTIVTIHGLEYEILPEAYSFWERLYMRFSIKRSCRWAKKIIAVSENTKRDLMRLYDVPENKIKVIYEGVSPVIVKVGTGRDLSLRTGNDKYILFIGRLEERKNIVGIIRAFEILKERYKIPHSLVLAGKFGYGAEKIKKEIENINHASGIILTGFVSEKEKLELLKNADLFLFPTFYEGFGLPILEAQSFGVPVVAGDNSSIREIANYETSENTKKNINSAILVDSRNVEAIADAVYGIIKNENLRKELIEKGYENCERFDWQKSAEETAKIIAEK